MQKSPINHYGWRRRPGRGGDFQLSSSNSDSDSTAYISPEVLDASSVDATMVVDTELEERNVASMLVDNCSAQVEVR